MHACALVILRHGFCKRRRERLLVVRGGKAVAGGSKSISTTLPADEVLLSCHAAAANCSETRLPANLVSQATFVGHAEVEESYPRRQRRAAPSRTMAAMMETSLPFVATTENVTSICNNGQARTYAG